MHDQAEALRASYHAKWEAAVAQEKQRRETAFLPWRSVAGKKVRPLTLRHIDLLRGIEHPVLTGAIAFPHQLAIVLWMIQPDWQPGSQPTPEFFKEVSRMNFSDTRDDITNLVDEAFFDLHTVSDSGRIVEQSKTAEITGWIDFFAHEYHWTIEQTLDTPFCQLVQLYRQVQIRTGNKSTVISSSDRIRDEYFRAANALQKGAA